MSLPKATWPLVLVCAMWISSLLTAQGHPYCPLHSPLVPSKLSLSCFIQRSEQTHSHYLLPVRKENKASLQSTSPLSLFLFRMKPEGVILPNLSTHLTHPMGSVGDWGSPMWTRDAGSHISKFLLLDCGYIHGTPSPPSLTAGTHPVFHSQLALLLCNLHLSPPRFRS